MSWLGDAFSAPFNSLGDLFSGNVGGAINDSLSPAEEALPGGMGDWLQGEVVNPAENFVGNNWNFEMDQLKRFGDMTKNDPFQLAFGAGDPLSTKVYDAVTGRNNTPYVDMFGGPTPNSYKYAASQGDNPEDASYMHAIAHAVAGAKAGGWAGGVLGTAAGVGSEIPAGSSALSDAAGATAGGGFGSSATAADAAAIPGWAGGGGGAYGAAVRGAGSGGLQAAGNALDNEGNPFKAGLTGFGEGALTGGLSSGIDPAGYAGVEDPTLKGIINGGLRGGIRAGMTDSDIGAGALVGGVSGGLNGAATPTNDPNDWHSQFYQMLSSGLGQAGQGVASAFLPGYQRTEMQPQGTSGPDYGSIAAGLGSMYLANKANQGIKGQINNLNSLFAPGSPYAKQLQQSLDRQDAAGGRRSQYGTRAVELQARLADAAARNAPTLSNLYGQQRQNDFSKYASMFAAARNNGLFRPGTYRGLGSIFGGQGNQPAMPTNEPLTPYQIPQTQMNNDVYSTLPDMYSGS